jgi:2-dehydropantoate 2-reductase
MMTHKKLNVICFGMGAIGTYIGGSLAANGANVVFIEKEEFVKTAMERGIRLLVGGEEIRVPEVKVTSNISEALAIQPADVALLAVKSFDTASVLESLSGFEMTFPPILCLQNGVENEAMIARRLGEDRVIGGSITTAIGRLGVGDIKLEKLRGVGIETNHEISKTLIEWFNLSGLRARGYKSRANMKWTKMLTNLLANASSAILNWTPGEVFSNPLTWQIEMEQIRETLDVMKAMHIHLVDLPGTPAFALMTLLKILPDNVSQKLIGAPLAKGRGAKMPSFHIDLYSGKGISEVSYLNGAVVRFAERVGLSAPVNDRLCKLLEQISVGEVTKEEFTNKPEKLDQWISGNL